MTVAKFNALTVFIVLFISGVASAQDLSDAKAICNDLTASNRAMARAAGYDVDKLCRSINGVQAQKNLTVRATAAAKPRGTASSVGKAAAPQTAAPQAAAPQAAAPQTAADVVAPMAVSGAKPVAKTASLKPFGYDLFANVPSTFAASTNIPVSPNYLLGPGDELKIFFYGKLNQSLSLQINRDGIVDFPELGPVVLAGLTFGEAKDMLRSRVATQVIGTQVNISMGSLRSMQVFVLGEAFKPGAYTVSSLTTITHALMSAGGVSDIASLRNIQLKRGGKTIATLDLYELLLSGNIGNDIRLQSSDVIYIPTVGDLVSVDGQVLRPAIYELKDETRIQDLIDLAGGLGPKAFAQSARIERINGDGFMTVVDIDLTEEAGRGHKIKSGDHLRVDGIIDRKESIVTLRGHVYHPGAFKWRQGMRLSDVVSSSSQFPPQLDLNYGLISREFGPIGDIKVITFRPDAILKDPDGDANIELESRDQIYLFSVGAGRNGQIDSLLKRLNFQAKAGQLAKTVSVSGVVRLGGAFPLTDDMKISDLIDAAGGLSVSHGLNDYAVLMRKTLPTGDIKAL
ncbi:MAG: SLBB domain-containing protein, partial [Porticoccaceae bacterium]|nr:SLBB domain-containing protein [Porticoccaceae bacterium]